MPRNGRRKKTMHQSPFGNDEELKLNESNMSQPKSILKLRTTISKSADSGASDIDQELYIPYIEEDEMHMDEKVFEELPPALDSEEDEFLSSYIAMHQRSHPQHSFRQRTSRVVFKEFPSQSNFANFQRMPGDVVSKPWSLTEEIRSRPGRIPPPDLPPFKTSKKVGDAKFSEKQKGEPGIATNAKRSWRNYPKPWLSGIAKRSQTPRTLIQPAMGVGSNVPQNPPQPVPEQHHDTDAVGGTVKVGPKVSTQILIKQFEEQKRYDELSYDDAVRSTLNNNFSNRGPEVEDVPKLNFSDQIPVGPSDLDNVMDRPLDQDPYINALFFHQQNMDRAMLGRRFQRDIEAEYNEFCNSSTGMSAQQMHDAGLDGRNGAQTLFYQPPNGIAGGQSWNQMASSPRGNAHNLAPSFKESMQVEQTPERAHTYRLPSQHNNPYLHQLGAEPEPARPFMEIDPSMNYYLTGSYQSNTGSEQGALPLYELNHGFPALQEQFPLLSLSSPRRQPEPTSSSKGFHYPPPSGFQSQPQQPRPHPYAGHLFPVQNPSRPTAFSSQQLPNRIPWDPRLQFQFQSNRYFNNSPAGADNVRLIHQSRQPTQLLPGNPTYNADSTQAGYQPPQLPLHECQMRPVPSFPERMWNGRSSLQTPKASGFFVPQGMSINQDRNNNFDTLAAANPINWEYQKYYPSSPYPPNLSEMFNRTYNLVYDAQTAQEEAANAQSKPRTSTSSESEEILKPEKTPDQIQEPNIDEPESVPLGKTFMESGIKSSPNVASDKNGIVSATGSVSLPICNDFGSCVESLVGEKLSEKMSSGRSSSTDSTCASLRVLVSNHKLARIPKKKISVGALAKAKHYGHKFCPCFECRRAHGLYASETHSLTVLEQTDYVRKNILDLQRYKKVQAEPIVVVDTPKGDKVPPIMSYTGKKGYGRIPVYLTKRKEEIARERSHRIAGQNKRAKMEAERVKREMMQYEFERAERRRAAAKANFCLFRSQLESRSKWSQMQADSPYNLFLYVNGKVQKSVKTSEAPIHPRRNEGPPSFTKSSNFSKSQRRGESLKPQRKETEPSRRETASKSVDSSLSRHRHRDQSKPRNRDLMNNNVLVRNSKLEQQTAQKVTKKPPIPKQRGRSKAKYGRTEIERETVLKMEMADEEIFGDFLTAVENRRSCSAPGRILAPLINPRLRPMGKNFAFPSLTYRLHAVNSTPTPRPMAQRDSLSNLRRLI